MKWLVRGVAALLVIIFLINTFGPRETIDWTLTFDDVELGDDLDRYLAEAEARVPNLKPGAEKTIRWAGVPGVKTDIALIYVHGFSASRNEIQPVPERVAEALGANLFQTRLVGHGRDGPALGGARANDWINDMAEALAIGAQLGERVVVIGTSTGATLSLLFSVNPGFEFAMSGMILISPNFEIAAEGANLLTRPFARTIVPWFCLLYTSPSPRDS